LTTEEIIKGCIQNNRRAQEALYRNYFVVMWRMCQRYTQDEDRLMSIVNDGFLRAFKKIHLYQFQGSLEGWIRRIVYNALSDYFRKENKYLKFLILEERDRKINPSIHNELNFDDVIQLVNRLPSTTKKVFTLYAIEGFTHKEIGQQLNISDGTSKWHLSEARKKLKEMVGVDLKEIYNG
jgi:RNA polymerase sigma factor (sigma-70 family)